MAEPIRLQLLGNHTLRVVFCIERASDPNDPDPPGVPSWERCLEAVRDATRKAGLPLCIAHGAPALRIDYSMRGKGAAYAECLVVQGKTLEQRAADLDECLRAQGLRLA
jgi:hypothetical protein